MYEFLGDILGSVEPTKTQRREVTLRESLDQAAKDVETKFANQPEVEAKVRNGIARIYLALGQYKAAEEQYLRALELRRRVLGDEHRDTLTAMLNLAVTLRKARRLDESEAVLRPCLEISRRVLGEEHPETVRAIQNLDSVLKDRGKMDEAK